MSVLAALMGEMHGAEEQDRPVLQIRITTDALPGTPAALPITPERARQVRLRAYPGDDGVNLVDADPEIWLRALEITVHPEDWMDLLRDPTFVRYGEPRSGRGLVVDQVLGVRVVK